jgi:hypothetical protein
VEKAAKERNRKMAERELAKLKERKETEKKFNEDLLALQTSEGAKKIFSKYSKQSLYLYSHYVSSDIIPLGIPRDVLYYKTFMNFARQFNIFPALLNQDQVSMIYKSLICYKPKVDNNPVGINLEEFEQALLRIAVRARKTLELITNKINSQKILDDNAESNSKGTPMNEDEIMKTDSKDDDDPFNMKNFNIQLLDQLFGFLDVPQDKRGMESKVNSLRKENAKSVPPRIRKHGDFSFAKTFLHLNSILAIDNTRRSMEKKDEEEKIQSKEVEATPTGINSWKLLYHEHSHTESRQNRRR